MREEQSRQSLTSVSSGRSDGDAPQLMGGRAAAQTQGR